MNHRVISDQLSGYRHMGKISMSGHLLSPMSSANMRDTAIIVCRRKSGKNYAVISAMRGVSFTKRGINTVSSQ